LKTNIRIDVYLDTICPWCYIGLTIIKDAIYDSSFKNFELIWRPFQLNPDMPLDGMDRQKYLEIKFQSKEKANIIYESIYKAGLRKNIYFQFDKMSRTPNSFASHKLLALAHKSKKQTEVLETLFYEYFIEGIDIGNLDELIRISKQHNIYNSKTLRYLKSSEDTQNLLAEESHARELGIKAVPCYIINNKYVLFGVQNKSNFLKIFQKIK